MFENKMKGGYSASSIIRNFMTFALTIFNTITLGIIVIIYLLCLHLPLAIWSVSLLYNYFYICPDDMKNVRDNVDLYNSLTDNKSTIVWKGLVKVFNVIFNIVKRMALLLLFIILLFFTIIIPYIFLIFYYLFVYLREKCKTN